MENSTDSWLLEKTDFAVLGFRPGACYRVSVIPAGGQMRTLSDSCRN